MLSIRAELLSAFQQAITDLLGEGNIINESSIQRASRPEFGDYQANFVMGFAKARSENPKAMADAVIQRVLSGQNAERPIFAQLESAGPGFINITLNKNFVIEHFMHFAPEHYVGQEKYRDQTVVIDYGGANVAKEMHVGHLRSTVIGDAIARILSFAGYRVIRQSHLGDWGTQFGIVYLMLTNQLCFCGSQQAYDECCADLHKEAKTPDTAEQLMRSRYSTYAQNNMSYIQKTMTGKAAVGFSLEKATKSASVTHWLALDVVQSYLDKKNPNHAFVEFRALYELNGNHAIMHELSEFKCIDGKWLYVDGQIIKSTRNDPCPCLSGKKFKKCHGAN